MRADLVAPAGSKPQEGAVSPHAGSLLGRTKSGIVGMPVPITQTSDSGSPPRLLGWASGSKPIQL